MIQIVGIIISFDQNFLGSWGVCAITPNYEQILTVTKFIDQIMFCIIQIYGRNEKKQTIIEILLIS
jgi:hypothetical protein